MDRDKHRDTERAECLYDEPDRHEVEEANKEINEHAGKARPPLMPGERTVPPD